MPKSYIKSIEQSTGIEQLLQLKVAYEQALMKADFCSGVLDSGSRQIASMVESLEGEATRLENAVQDLAVS